MPKTKVNPSSDSEIAPRLKSTDSGASLTLPLDSDGDVDWSKVRESTKEKFKSVLSSDATTLEMVADIFKDMETDDETPERPKITEDNIGAAIDQINLACSMSLALLVGKFKKHPFVRGPQGQQVPLSISPNVVMTVSELTPAQHKELDPRGLALANKYIPKVPSKITEHLDLIMFGFMFLKYQQQNLSKMVATQIALDIKASMQVNQAKPKVVPPDSDRPTNGQAGPHEGESLDPGFIPPMGSDDQPRV